MTIASDLGWKVGDEGVVLEDFDEIYKGDIVVLSEDDGTYCPYFIVKSDPSSGVFLSITDDTEPKMVLKRVFEIPHATIALKAADEANSQDNLIREWNNLVALVILKMDDGEYRAGVEVSANSVREIIDWLTNKGYKINLPTKTNPNKQFIWIYWGTDDQVTPLDSICGF